MNSLLNVGLRFRAKYKKIDGSSFYGQILEIPDTSRVSNFLSARRYLRTQPKTNVSARDVIVVNGVMYIVAEHGDGFYVDPIYKHFKLFEVDQTLEHYAMVGRKNPVTGVEQFVRDAYTDDVYLSTQPHSLIKDSINIPQTSKTAISDKELAVDDRVGPYLVIKSDIVLGVNLVELKTV